jgi:tRNA threonylcarbamoyladenosine biosynthesis protein TsaE
MKKLGQIVGEQCQPNDIICLRGEMGTGKTVFSQGFIQHLTMNDQLHVTSPTFLLDNIYQPKLIHLQKSQ